MANFQDLTPPKHIIDDICEWAIMHGIAFRQADNSARHCPFSLAPIAMHKHVFRHLREVTPILSELIDKISEDHSFLQSSLTGMSQADPFFGRLMELHQQAHGTSDNRITPARKPLLLMRTDFMDDRQHGAKVIEFNGIAAGMGPFGQRAHELHSYVSEQWSKIYQQWQENAQSEPLINDGLQQLAIAIANTAKQVQSEFEPNAKTRPLFLMVVQKDEDNVYDQHLLEVELQKLGVRTARRTFEQLSSQLATGDNKRLLLKDVGAIDVIYLRAGYQFIDYCAPELDDDICCHSLSQTRLFMEKHHVAMNATISQQLATSKTMQMQLTMMPAEEYSRWGISLEQANQIKTVLAEMVPVNEDTISWFNTQAKKQDWVLKNQGEGGGHCIFGNDISEKLSQLSSHEHDAWAFMQRLFPHEREHPTLAIRDSKFTVIDDLVSEIGLFTAFYKGKPITDYDGYAGYLIRSKPASENEGGIHSGQGILDSLTLID